LTHKIPGQRRRSSAGLTTQRGKENAMQEINKDEVEDVGGGLQFPGSGIPGMPTPLPGPGWPNPCPVPNPFADN
jgi:hypothetical protein